MLSSYSRGPRHPLPMPMLPPVALTYFKAEGPRADDLTVLLDGAPMPLAIEASAIEGWVMTYEADGAELKKDALGRTVIVRLRGKVEIRRA